MFSRTTSHYHRRLSIRSHLKHDIIRLRVLMAAIFHDAIIAAAAAAAALRFIY